MITISKLVVRSFSLDHLDLFWEIPEVTEELEEYDFFVLRSIDGAVGPFEIVAGPFYNTFHYRDTGVHLLHRWRQYYYKIRVTHRRTQTTHEHGPVWLQAEPDRIGLELQRRQNLILKEFNGRLVFLLPALTFGQRCPSCWDRGPKGNTIGRSTIQNCQTCFDTTFVGGFSTPIAFWMQIDPSPKSTQRTDLEEHQFSSTSGRAGSFPPLKVKDVIVEAENRRWLINKVTPTEKFRSTMRQELELWELTKDDIKFKVPINYDLMAEHTAHRNYTRPMTLQAEQIEPVKDLLEPGDET